MALLFIVLYTENNDASYRLKNNSKADLLIYTENYMAIYRY